jgi:hypothetical protein
VKISLETNNIILPEKIDELKTKTDEIITQMGCKIYILLNR